MGIGDDVKYAALLGHCHFTRLGLEAKAVNTCAAELVGIELNT